MSAAPGTGLLEVVSTPARSVVSRAFAASPLRLLTPRSHGGAAWVYSGSYGGGLVSGDALRLGLRVGPRARVFLSTQASTKVYRSPAGTSVDLEADVGEDALLIAWPDPVVCFAGSRYAQRQHVELAAGAGLLLVDWLTSGRHAAGERWRFEAYTSRLVIRQEGRLVVQDALRLSPADGNLARRMGRFDVLCTVALVGPPLRDAAQAIQHALGQLPIEKQSDALVAAAAIRGGGCLLRLAGRSVEQVGRLLRAQLAFVSCLLGDDPWARKW